MFENFLFAVWFPGNSRTRNNTANKKSSSELFGESLLYCIEFALVHRTVNGLQKCNKVVADDSRIIFAYLYSEAIFIKLLEFSKFFVGNMHFRQIKNVAL